MSNAVVVLPDNNMSGIWFAAADAAGGGKGFIDDPLTITEALTSPFIVPGAHVFLRGGVYEPPTRTINCTFTGTSEAPITVSNYPGEVAELRFEIAQVGSHVHYISTDYGLLRRDVLTDRINEIDRIAPPPGQANFLSNVAALGIRVINVRIENAMGTGITWVDSLGGEIYGVICHDNGWEGTDRKHGAGIYAANGDNTFEKVIENCILINTFTGTVQLGEGDTSGQPADHMTVRNVTSVGNAVISATTRGDKLLIDGVWLRAPYNLVLGIYYEGGDNGSAVISNCITDTPLQFATYRWQSLDVQQNTFTAMSYINEESAGGNYIIANNAVVSSGVYSEIIPNIYAPKFAQLRVFDFDETGNVTIDVSAFMTSGTMRVRNPMLWDSEYIDLMVSEGVITLPMTGWTTPPPTGWDEPFYTVFSARFGVFIAENIT